jgi:hypothetical protein
MGNRSEAEPPGRLVAARRSWRPSEPFRLALIAALTVGAGAYAWWVSSTTPFTGSADVAVAAGFALMAVPAAVSFLHHGVRRAGDDHDSDVSSVPVAVDGERPKVRAWTAAMVALVAYELFTYFAGSGGSRHTFPTLSSLYDDLASTQAVKALIVFAWLALGWGLFHRRSVGTEARGSPSR